MNAHLGRLALLVLVAGAAPLTAQQFNFRDVTREAGLLPDVAGVAGHAVAWGDIDGTGFPSLYVGSFGGKPYDAKPALLFRNVKGKFQLDDQKHLRNMGRGNGGVFVDLTNSGKLDLYYTNHSIDSKGHGKGAEHFSAPNALFRNDGGGKFTEVSKDSGACPLGFAARSVCALDYDGDGLIDLLVGECYFQGGQSRSKLFRNLGNYKFENVTTKVGLPEKVTGFGVAACDVNNDGWPDIFLAGREGGNRLYLNDGKGHFKEVPKSHADFQWKFPAFLDETSCGVCFGDVNRDGLMDIVVGHHYSSPWTTGGVPVRMYLNRGLDGAGVPRYEDVTEKAGLKPLPMKAPHVELQDFDNDGWPDLYVSIVKFAAGKTYPVVFKNQGTVSGGLPVFKEDALAVNDFPTPADLKLAGSGEFFDKMKKENKIVYMAPGASADYDRDGRLDLFLANWWPDRPSLLLKNETKSGNWLQVEVNMASRERKRPEVVNRQGIGSRVNVYEAGKLGQKAALLGAREIAVGYGYASGQEAMAHLGLGTTATCDVEVILPHGKGRISRRNVKANQRLAVQ